MTSIKDFSELTQILARRESRRRVAVVWPADEQTLHSVARAVEADFVEAVLIGEADAPLPQTLCRTDRVARVVATDPKDAAEKAVAMVREGKADVLMKGLVGTDVLLHAVLNRDTGILPRGRVLTHVTAATVAFSDKMLFFTDAAVIPYPTPEQLRAQLTAILDVCRRMGIAEPRVSLLHCTEKVNEKLFPFTSDYVALRQEAESGAYGPCVVDGPLDLKTSLSAKAMRTKGIDSPIAGAADALIFPDIEAANVFYKAITLYPSTETAGMLHGTLAPVVLPSRGDSETSKLNSLALACV